MCTRAACTLSNPLITLVFFIRKARSASYWANCHLQHEEMQLVNVSTAQIYVLRDESTTSAELLSHSPQSHSHLFLWYTCVVGWQVTWLQCGKCLSSKLVLHLCFPFGDFFLPYQSFPCFYFLFFEIKRYSSLFQKNFFVSNSAVHFPPRGLKGGWNNLKTKPNIKLNFCCWFLNWIKNHLQFTQFYLKGFCGDCQHAYE